MNFNVKYFSDFYNQEEADKIFDELKQLSFQSHTVTVCGKKYTPRRKICAYGDSGLKYSFSGVTISAQPWIPVLLKVKEDVEKKLKCQYNFVLLNLYEDGLAKIGAHKDDEKDLLPTASIATLSLGASRKFIFKKKNFVDVEYEPQHGSLLVMEPPTNRHWSHQIPEEPEVKHIRISATFRYILSASAKRPLEMTSNPGASKNNNDCEELPEGDWMDEALKKDSTTFDTIPSKRLCSVDDLGLCMERDNSEYHIFTSKEFSLSESTRCSVKVFQNSPRIDIRRYKLINKRRIPTREGIVLSPLTWYYFCCKIFNFNFIYKDASFIANNCLLALNLNGLHLQNIDCYSNNSLEIKKPFITLNEEEVSKLLELEKDITNFLIDLIWLHILPHKISLIYPTTLDSSNVVDSDALQSNFISCIERKFNSVIKSVFQCYGCIIDNFSQTNHECMTLSIEERFKSLGPRAWVLLPVDDIINDLRSQPVCVNINIVKNFTMSDYRTMLFI